MTPGDPEGAVRQYGRLS